MAAECANASAATYSPPFFPPPRWKLPALLRLHPSIKRRGLVITKENPLPHRGVSDPFMDRPKQIFPLLPFHPDLNNLVGVFEEELLRLFREILLRHQKVGGGFRPRGGNYQLGIPTQENNKFFHLFTSFLYFSIIPCRCNSRQRGGLSLT